MIEALRVRSFDTLTARELDAWHELRAADPALDSPYFHPGFAAAVHATGNRVHVVVGEDRSGAVRALMPLHREGSTARPAGSPGADFQGPVLAPGAAFPPLHLLAAAGVRAYWFDHLLDSHVDFAPWVETRRPSPFLDVTGGLDGYLGRASRSGKDKMSEARRLANKAERDHGAVRFVADSTDHDVLDRVIDLKRAQYAATGARDYFADPRRRELMHALLRTRGSSFGGLLSTVHSGPQLLAAHFGIRSDDVLHWWFPVYDKRFAPLSPGWVLLREVVRAAGDLGIHRIDLGRGEDDYKRRAMTGATTVCEGMVSGSVRGALHKARRRALAAAKASPLGPRLRAVARKLRS